MSQQQSSGEMNRRDFLKSLGIVATSLAIPVSIQSVAKLVTPSVQSYSQNYLTLQGAGKFLVAGIKAIDLDMADREGILRVVLEDNFNPRELVNYGKIPSRLQIDMVNGVPINRRGWCNLLCVPDSRGVMSGSCAK